MLRVESEFVEGGCPGPEELEAVLGTVLLRLGSRQLRRAFNVGHQEVSSLSTVVLTREELPLDTCAKGALLAEFPDRSVLEGLARFDASSG